MIRAPPLVESISGRDCAVLGYRGGFSCRKGEGCGAGRVSGARLTRRSCAEPERLRKENKDPRIDREILCKAAEFPTQETSRGSAG
jgi:hypothetical protein